MVNGSDSCIPLILLGPALTQAQCKEAPIGLESKHHYLFYLLPDVMWRTDDNDQSFWVVRMLQQLALVYTQDVKYIYTFTHTLLEGPTDSIHLQQPRWAFSSASCELVGSFQMHFGWNFLRLCCFWTDVHFFWKQWDVTHSLWSVLVLPGQWFLRLGGFQVGCKKNKTPRSTQCSLWCFVSGSGSALMSCDIPFTCSSTNCVSRSMMRICPWVFFGKFSWIMARRFDE